MHYVDAYKKFVAFLFAAAALREVFLKESYQFCLSVRFIFIDFVIIFDIPVCSGHPFYRVFNGKPSPMNMYAQIKQRREDHPQVAEVFYPWSCES